MGYKETENAMQQFARNVAQAAGGTYRPFTDRDGDVLGHGCYVTIDGVELFIQTTWRGGGKQCGISVQAPKRSPYERAALPAIKVSLSREPAKAAQDIKRRAVEPAKPILAEIAQRLADFEAKTSNAESELHELQRKFPGVTFTRERDSTNISFNYYNDGRSFYGTIYGNDISVSRASGIPRDRFGELFNIFRQ